MTLAQTEKNTACLKAMNRGDSVAAIGISFNQMELFGIPCREKPLVNNLSVLDMSAVFSSRLMDL